MDVIVPTINTIASVARKILMIKQTPYFTIHVPIKEMVYCMYLFFVLWPGCSIMETSLQLIFHITYATVSLKLLWRESLVLLTSQIM